MDIIYPQYKCIKLAIQGTITDALPS